MTLSNLIFVLLIWISNNTDYQISKFDYSVNVIDKKIIQEKVCNGKCPIIAYFDPNHGVFIAKGNLEEPCYQSILLHEMIHAFQFTLNKNIANAFKEMEAYSLQNLYLNQISEKKNLLRTLNLKSCRSKQYNTLF
tara:strand:+ start:1550 stop:1954 length:405 start_codon:yes stop_codon:yes gene_type:complete